MKFIITVNKLKVHAPIGVFEFEKEKGNDLEVNIEIEVECNEQSIRADELKGTLDYSVATEVAQRVLAQPCNLIETASLRIIEALKKEFVTSRNYRLIRISVEIAKLNPPIGNAEVHSASSRLTIDL